MRVLIYICVILMGFVVTSCHIFIPKSPIKSDKVRKLHYVAVKIEGKKEKRKKKRAEKKLKEGDAIVNEDGILVDPETGEPIPDSTLAMTKKEQRQLKKKQRKEQKKQEELTALADASDQIEGDTSEVSDWDDTEMAADAETTGASAQKKTKKKKRKKKKWDDLNTSNVPTKYLELEKADRKAQKKAEKADKKKLKKKDAAYQEGGLLVDEEGNPIESAEEEDEFEEDFGDFEEGDSTSSGEFDMDTDTDEDMEMEESEVISKEEMRAIKKEDRKMNKEKRKQERKQRKEEGYVKLYRSRVTPIWRLNQSPKIGDQWRPPRKK